MEPRLNPFAAAPAAMQAWLDYGKGVLQCGLEDSLMELVEIRASQINGCASCLHMHTASAREHGETEERQIYGESTVKEAVDLVEEGIDVAPLPPDPDEAAN